MTRATLGARLPMRILGRATRLSRASTAILIVSLIIVMAAFGLRLTGALFTSEYPVTGSVSAGKIFPGERITTAFSVIDSSSGTAVDASNPIAFTADGRTTTTATWATAFASDRYIEFEMNSPLPSGLSLTSASFDFAWANSGSTTCFYFEVRTPTGTLLGSHGSADSPVACATGPSSTSTPVTSVTSTDDANGMRVRVFASDSVAGPALLDAATVQGDYGLAAFTLYPVELIDAADASASLIRWGPAGP